MGAAAAVLRAARAVVAVAKHAVTAAAAALRERRKEPHAELAEVGDVDPAVVVEIEGGVVVRLCQVRQREEAEVRDVDPAITVHVAVEAEMPLGVAVSVVRRQPS